MPSVPVIIATRNKGKISELAPLLEEAGFTVRELPSDFPEIDESGMTFEENALLKARAVATGTGCAAIADDSGLEVDALHGAPGVLSARFSDDLPLLPHETKDDRNIRKLLQLMNGIHPSDRSARFRCCMAFVTPSGHEITASGSWEGRISLAPTGKQGFGYDPVFIDGISGKTAAELTKQEKNALSHRGKATRRLMELLKNAD